MAQKAAPLIGGAVPVAAPGLASIDSAGAVPAAIRFDRPPRWRRIRQESEIYLGGDISVGVRVSVHDTNGRPVPGAPVSLFVRSTAGSNGSAETITNATGQAALEVLFLISPGSLDATVQACTQRGELCTPPVSVSLRQRLDFSLTSTTGYFASRHKATINLTREKIELPYTDNTIQSVLTPRLQLNVWETERDFKYYGLSVYGSLPLTFQDRSMVSILQSRSVDRAFGVGDFAVGTVLQLQRKVALDASFNSHNSSLNAVDGLRSFGVARPVSMGDGLASFDWSVAAHHKFSQAPVLLAQFTGSHAMKRDFAGGDRASRGAYLSATGSAGFLRRSRAFALYPWARFEHRGALTLTQRGTSTQILPRRNEASAGITYGDQRSGPMGAQLSFFAGGIGAGEIYLAMTLELEFRDFWKLQ
jgi:hypothetical protein